MPNKVSYTGKILQMEEVNHTHCFSRCSSSLIFLKNLLNHGQLVLLYFPSLSAEKYGVLSQEKFSNCTQSTML